jgi:excinuclease ABC subunit C
MLQQARDEAHRFAVTYNRKRRSLRTVTSELLSIPGIGPSKRRLLLQNFGSIQGVRNASVEQIAALPGFSESSARKLLDLLIASGQGRTITPPGGAPRVAAEPPPNGTDPLATDVSRTEDGSAADAAAPNDPSDVTSSAITAAPTPSPTPERP